MKKKIINTLKKENNELITYNPNYNKLAEALNISKEEDIKKDKSSFNRIKSNKLKLVARIAFSLFLVAIGFLSSFFIFYKYNNNNVLYNRVEAVFNLNNARYIKNPIYTTTFEDYGLLYVYYGITPDNKKMFVIEVESSFYFKCNEYKDEFSYANENSVFIYFDFSSNTDYYFQISKDDTFDSSDLFINLSIQKYSQILLK